MGIFRKDDGVGIERLFIELGDAHKSKLVHKWPDQQVRRGSRLTVDADYVAVFTNAGQVVGTYAPGQHVLDEGAPLAYAWLSDHLTADGQYDCEIYFVTTRLVTGVAFGGPVDHVRDPETGFVAGLRVFGEFAARAADPVALITAMVGTADLASDEAVRRWMTGQVMAAIRESASAFVDAHGLYGLGSSQQALEDTSREAANVALAGTGLVVDGYAQLHLNMDDETVAQLRQFAATKGYVEIAGSYDQYARGQAMMDMAHGLAAGGGDGDGAGGDGGGTSSLIAAGMLFGGMGPFGGPGQGAPAPVAPAGDDVLDRLERLQKLWDDGVLSDEEFESQKRRILGS